MLGKRLLVVSTEDLHAALAQFDRDFRHTPEWAGWEQNKAHLYAIQHQENRYPVKQIVSMATGLAVSEFSGGQGSGGANAYVTSLGFTVVKLKSRDLVARHLPLSSEFSIQPSSNIFARRPLPPPVGNLSELTFLAEMDDSARFATLSFPVKTKIFSPRNQYEKERILKVPLRDNASRIAEVVKRRHPAILLCAGWSISRAALPLLEDATRDVPSVVLVEETLLENERPMNYRISEGKAVAMGRQFFSTRADTTDDAVRDLEDSIEDRQFALGRENVFLMVCGELIVLGSKADPIVEKSKMLRDALDKATIILNPTHTLMGNAGMIKAKRRVLSENGALYLSASNWDTGGKKRQNICRTIHTAWQNGAALEHRFCHEDNEHFCYREWSPD